MSMRVAALAVVFTVLCSCNPGGDSPATPPVAPVFPAATPADPQQKFDMWKDIVSAADATPDSSLYGQLAIELRDSDPKYLNEMIDMLVDPATKPESRILILSSLEAGLTPSIYPRLLELTKPGVDPAIRAGVVILLKNAADPAVTQRIRQLVTDPERRVRLAAMMDLSEQGDPESRAALVQYYFTDGLPPAHRARIVQSLALNPEPGDVKVFVAALNDGTLPEDPRLVSTGALGRIADPAGIDPLRTCAAGDNSPKLKEAAAYAASVIEKKHAAVSRNAK